MPEWPPPPPPLAITTQACAARAGAMARAARRAACVMREGCWRRAIAMFGRPLCASCVHKQQLFWLQSLAILTLLPTLLYSAGSKTHP